MPARRVVGRLIAYVEGMGEQQPYAVGCGCDLKTQQVSAPVQHEQPGPVGHEYLTGLRRPFGRLTAFRLWKRYLPYDIELAVGSVGGPAAYLIRARQCRPNALGRVV